MQSYKYLNLHKLMLWTFLSALCGLFAGLSAAVFLFLLQLATHVRDVQPWIIWALPLAGFFIGWLYFRFGKDVVGGNNLILDEIHDPKKVVPLKMAPLILIATVLTHLFGGSAGREGTAVQMGASLADQLSRIFRINFEERKILLVAGAGAGFGAAIGAPWAGMIFGMEVINVGRLKLFAIFECFVASFVGYYVTILVRAPHSLYPHFPIPGIEFKLVIYVVTAGLIFGLASQFFTVLAHGVEKIFKGLFYYPPLRPLVGGLILVILYQLEGSHKYAGLGIPFIQDSILEPQHFREPLMKSIFTAITVGSGFKGGEFIPLVFVGATLGSALSIIIPVSFQLLAGLGFAAVFAGAANTPIACSLMAMELFGYKIAPYAVIACFTSYYFSGHHGIYSSQLIHRRKFSFFRMFQKKLRHKSAKGSSPPLDNPSS